MFRATVLPPQRFRASSTYCAFYAEVRELRHSGWSYDLGLPIAILRVERHQRPYHFSLSGVEWFHQASSGSISSLYLVLRARVYLPPFAISAAFYRFVLPASLAY